MDYLGKVQAVLDRYEDDQESLDKEQLFLMLKHAVDGLENCDKEGAAKEMFEAAGYDARF